MSSNCSCERLKPNYGNTKYIYYHQEYTDWVTKQNSDRHKNYTKHFINFR